MSPGQFVWYELVTSDPLAAGAFYADVVGWTLADAGVPGMSYTLARIGDRSVAGLMAPPPAAPDARPKWFGYILVDDVDRMAAQAQAAGGTIHRPPTDIPGVGRFAVMADPQGAVVMLFRGSGEPPADLAPGTPGSIAWHELRTTDAAAAFAFYQGLFGWEPSYAHDMGPMGTYQTFSVGGVWTGGIMRGTDAPPHWGFAIQVDDIDAAAARVSAAGGRVLHGPHPVPGDTWIVMASDPQGASFILNGARRG